MVELAVRFSSREISFAGSRPNLKSTYFQGFSDKIEKTNRPFSAKYSNPQRKMHALQILGIYENFQNAPAFPLELADGATAEGIWAGGAQYEKLG